MTDPTPAIAEARAWLNTYEAEPKTCTHPIRISTVSALHAAATIGRVATEEARRERDEALARIDQIAVCLRQIARRPDMSSGHVRLVARSIELGEL